MDKSGPSRLRAIWNQIDNDVDEGHSQPTRSNQILVNQAQPVRQRNEVIQGVRYHESSQRGKVSAANKTHAAPDLPDNLMRNNDNQVRRQGRSQNRHRNRGNQRRAFSAQSVNTNRESRNDVQRNNCNRNRSTQNGSYNNSNCVPESQEKERVGDVIPTRKREVRTMSFIQVKELAEKTPGEIVLTVTNNTSGFILLFDKMMKRDMAAYVFLALGKSVSAFMSRHVNNMINIITSHDKFSENIQNYLASFQKFPSEDYHLLSLAGLTEFLYKFQLSLPSSATDILLVVMPLLQKICQRYLQSSSSLYADVTSKLQDIDNQNELFLQKYTPAEVKRVSEKERLQLMEPPESYRTLPTLPDTNDIHCAFSFVRPNIVAGRYQDSEHYLDVQYRLLREDYVKPLRDGIAEYRRLKKNGKHIKHCKDVRVYENVNIIKQQFVNGGLVHLAHFKDNNFSRIKWEYSKRFLSGSLLCFTSNDFESMLFAIVARRMSEELKKGLLVLKFENLSDEVLNISSQTSFVVIETTAYFEAYRHNLDALKQLNETNLPMKRYIVEVEKEVGQPQYLTPTVTYDMRPLLVPLSEEFIKRVKVEKGKISINYAYPANIVNKAKCVNVQNEACWPTSSELNLDLSQYNALKAAITKEFAVIQGPPGTGKTYVGLRIAQLLLHNMSKWDTNNHSPILVVCYTNHALDQFLEGLLLFTEKIVRVGGRGQNEALAKFQINNLKRAIKDKREVPHYIFSSLKQKQMELNSLQKDIDDIKKSVDKSYENILVEIEMYDCIPEFQYQSLCKFKLKSSGNQILHWLEAIPGASHSFDDAYLLDDDTEDLADTDFLLTDIYKEEFVNIAVNRIDDRNTDDENNRLRVGSTFKQILSRCITDILDNCTPFSYEGAINIRNVWNLEIIYRWKLYIYWFHCFIKRKQEEYVAAVNDYRQKAENNRTDKYELLLSKEHIQLVKINLRSLPFRILDENSLKEVIPDFHYHSLLNSNMNMRDVGNVSILYCWLQLNLRNQNDLQNRMEIVRSLRYISNLMKSDNLAMEDRTPMVEEDEFGSEGEADIDYIEAMREIDSDEFADAIFDDLPVTTLRKINLIPEIDSGWKVQGGEKQLKRYIRNNLRNEDKMTEEEARVVTDVWTLPLKQRWRLYKYWLDSYVQKKGRETYNLQQQLREQYEEICELRTEEDMYICRQADVVGMTTTGAAKYRKIVQNMNPKIVIVEEAAEILESHLVTSLAPGTQHVILIGDHQQLRPSPTVHLLSVKYDLNVSLFERMVQNGLDCHQLSIQHRMRPEIASLLVPHIYEHLDNHESVTRYDNIKGVMKNIFFITHSFSELQENDSKSKVNEHEAKFILQLCRYFILQGYEPSQITVLTTYSGQLFTLRKLSKKIHQGVRMTVVDNFQGEENEIILVSFVRSNEDGEIGFLKVSNRVCVALSRAKKGLFCVGNFELLSERSVLWKNIVTELQNNQAIGASLQLVCQNHPCTSNTVANEKDFDSVPEGGCTRSCEYRLMCGHVCPLMCHAYDTDHLHMKCSKPCTKTCEYGHPCKKKCSQKCGPCFTLVDKTLDICGHTMSVPCHERYEETKCTKPCERVLNCGHNCLRICGNSCSVKCERRCTVKSLICGHNIEVECFRSKDIEYLINKCKEPCRTQLSCQHFCQGTCSTCHQGRLHVNCRQKCKRILVCGHECKSSCAKSCPPCERPCENRCVHSKCPKSCGEPCEKCNEPCEWICEHKGCSDVCGDLCNRSPCDKNCPKKLECGHPCIGLCGEPCPRQCRICNKDEVIEIFFGSEDEMDARFICLEDCNHIFEVDGLKQWMTMKNSEAREIQMKACPKCKTVIRKNLRFGNVIKSCLNDIEKVKKITYGDKRKNITKAANLARHFERADEKFCQIGTPIEKALKSGKNRNVQELTVIENILSILKSFVKTLKCLDIEFSGEHFSDAAFFDSIKTLQTYLKKTAQWLRSFFQDDYLTASEQQLEELTWEVHRLKLADKFLNFVSNRGVIKSENHADAIINCLMTYQPFREKDVETFSTEFKSLNEKMGGAVINVSDMEKESILKAMGLSKGHWYQCPRGHVYCITECGGAMQIGKCNECGEQIGGQSHSLLRSNRVATAMDGSQYPAWSDNMNMLNYRF